MYITQLGYPIKLDIIKRYSSGASAFNLTPNEFGDRTNNERDQRFISGLPLCTSLMFALSHHALASAKPNDGAPYEALEVAVATSGFIAAPRRISLASFHSVGSSRTPEEVWTEGHVSVKWPISRVTITATNRLDKPSKVPADVRDPERVSFPVTTRTYISSDRHVTFRPFERTATPWLQPPYITIVTYLARSWTSSFSRVGTRTLLQPLEVYRAQTHGKNED